MRKQSCFSIKNHCAQVICVILLIGSNAVKRIKIESNCKSLFQILNWFSNRRRGIQIYIHSLHTTVAATIPRIYLQTQPTLPTTTMAFNGSVLVGDGPQSKRLCTGKAPENNDPGHNNNKVNIYQIYAFPMKWFFFWFFFIRNRNSHRNDFIDVCILIAMRILYVID